MTFPVFKSLSVSHSRVYDLGCKPFRRTGIPAEVPPPSMAGCSHSLTHLLTHSFIQAPNSTKPGGRRSTQEQVSLVQWVVLAAVTCRTGELQAGFV